MTEQDVAAAITAAGQEAVRRIQAQIEDQGVRGARDNGWCSVFNEIMWNVFPSGPLDGTDWRDSDGVDCKGREWRDAEGYNRAGFNINGRDRELFDTEGYNPEGYNRAGLDVDGFSKDDPQRFQYNSKGYNRNGFNAQGGVYRYLTRDMLNEWATAEGFTFDRNGWNVEGFDQAGYNAAGFDRKGLNINGFDKDGFGIDGWGHPHGEWMHRDTGNRYDAAGFDRHGYHETTGSGYGPDGYTRNGTDRYGQQKRPDDASVTA